MAAASPPLPTQNRITGIGARIGAAMCFGIMAAMIKLGHEAGINLVELIFYRFLLGLPPILFWIALTRNLGAWRTRRPAAHVVRSVIGLTTMALAFGALAFLPLAEATTIGFVAPCFSVILSVLILRESVGRHRWTAVGLGFAGVLIIIQPAGTDLPAAGIALALAAAFGVALVTITIRQISRTEGAPTTVLWFTGLSIAATAMLMPAFAESHDGREWLILIGLGLAGGTGQLFLTTSLRIAPVPVVVPFDYSQLLIAVSLGWLIWDTSPPSSTWAGAAVIVASGLYTLYREHRLGRDRLHLPPLQA